MKYKVLGFVISICISLFIYNVYSSNSGNISSIQFFESPEISNNSELPLETGIKFVLRWSGKDSESCSCPGCACPGCPCPLGMCFCSSISGYSGGTLAGDEGSGTAWIDDEEKLHVIFDQTTHIVDNELGNVVPVTGNIYFTSDLAQYFGYESIYIHQGFYTIDLSEHTFGEVIFTVTTTTE